MLKLMVMIGAFLLVGLSLLGLRQHRLELTSQTAKLHDQILEREQVMWGQELQIAKTTNPLAVSEGLKTAMPELTAAYLPRGTAPARGVRTPAPGGDRDLIAPLRRRRP